MVAPSAAGPVKVKLNLGTQAHRLMRSVTGGMDPLGLGLGLSGGFFTQPTLSGGVGFSGGAGLEMGLLPSMSMAMTGEEVMGGVGAGGGLGFAGSVVDPLDQALVDIQITSLLLNQQQMTIGGDPSPAPAAAAAASLLSPRDLPAPHASMLTPFGSYISPKSEPAPPVVAPLRPVGQGMGFGSGSSARVIVKGLKATPNLPQAVIDPALGPAPAVEKMPSIKFKLPVRPPSAPTATPTPVLEPAPAPAAVVAEAAPLAVGYTQEMGVIEPPKPKMPKLMLKKPSMPAPAAAPAPATATAPAPAPAASSLPHVDAIPVAEAPSAHVIDAPAVEVQAPAPDPAPATAPADGPAEEAKPKGIKLTFKRKAPEP